MGKENDRLAIRDKRVIGPDPTLIGAQRVALDTTSPK